MSILQYIRYFVIGLIPFSIIIIIINAISYGPDYINIIFGIIMLAYLTVFIIFIGSIIDEVYLRKW